MMNQGAASEEIKALIRKKMGIQPPQAMASTQDPSHGMEEQTEDPNAPDPDDQGPPPIDEAAMGIQPPQGGSGYGGQPSIMELAQMGSAPGATAPSQLSQVAPVAGGVPGMIANNQAQHQMLRAPVNGQGASPTSVLQSTPTQGVPGGGNSMNIMQPGSPEQRAALQQAVMRMMADGPAAAQAAMQQKLNPGGGR